MQRQIKIVLVGAGNRADIYSTFSLKTPERMKVVGIVDPDKEHMEKMRKKYSVPEENCFTDLGDFLKREKFADAVINGTMDHLHVVTSIPILEAGYDLLLEKPFAVNEEELRRLVKVANDCKRKVYICHVLRYTPFYSAIKRHLVNHDIGDILSIEMCEHVNYHHMAAAYVRGKWRSPKLCFAPMLLAKSCHDMDIMMWMMSETKPKVVHSYGSDIQFMPDKKPKEAGERCMVDCPLNGECAFSCEANYVTHPRWHQYVAREMKEGDTPESFANSLKTYNPYGKCVWDFERDGNVDHQAVLINFENGVTGTFTMTGGAARSERNIHIVGTKGEIKGTFEESKYILRKIAPYTSAGYEDTVIDLKITGDMIGAYGAHGGGDGHLVYDFLDVLCGGEKPFSATDINDSTVSHLVVFAAERARKSGMPQIMELDV